MMELKAKHGFYGPPPRIADDCESPVVVMPFISSVLSASAICVSLQAYSVLEVSKSVFSNYATSQALIMHHSVCYLDFGLTEQSNNNSV